MPPDIVFRHRLCRSIQPETQRLSIANASGESDEAKLGRQPISSDKAAGLPSTLRHNQIFLPATVHILYLLQHIHPTFAPLLSSSIHALGLEL